LGKVTIFKCISGEGVQRIFLKRKKEEKVIMLVRDFEEKLRFFKRIIRGSTFKRKGIYAIMSPV